MKKFRQIYHSDMLRPIIYSVFTKFVCTLCLVLLWDRFVNSRNVVPYGVVDFAFFIVGMWFLLWTWVRYLQLDEIRNMVTEVFRKVEEMINFKAPRHSSRDMVDFVNEKVITFDMLEEDEQVAAKFASNGITAVIFIGISLLSLVLPF